MLSVYSDPCKAWRVSFLDRRMFVGGHNGSCRCPWLNVKTTSRHYKCMVSILAFMVNH